MPYPANEFFKQESEEEFKQLAIQFYNAFKRGNHGELKQYWDMMKNTRSRLISHIKATVDSKKQSAFRDMFRSTNDKVIEELNRIDENMAHVVGIALRQGHRSYFYIYSNKDLQPDHMIRVLSTKIPLEKTIFWKECIKNPNIWERCDPDRWDSWNEYEHSKLYANIQEEIARKRAHTNIVPNAQYTMNQNISTSNPYLVHTERFVETK